MPENCYTGKYQGKIRMAAMVTPRRVSPNAVPRGGEIRISCVEEVTQKLKM